MSVVIIVKKLKLNPDNIATPVAGSIGDIGALVILSYVGTFYYKYSNLYLILNNFILFF